MKKTLILLPLITACQLPVEEPRPLDCDRHAQTAVLHMKERSDIFDDEWHSQSPRSEAAHVWDIRTEALSEVKRAEQSNFPSCRREIQEAATAWWEADKDAFFTKWDGWRSELVAEREHRKEEYRAEKEARYQACLAMYAAKREAVEKQIDERETAARCADVPNHASERCDNVFRSLLPLYFERDAYKMHICKK